MPTTRPPVSSSGPPELPGFTAASNWISPLMGSSLPGGVDWRPSPDTTPALNEATRPRGLPTANTSSPTRSADSASNGSRKNQAGRRGRRQNGDVPLPVHAGHGGGCPGAIREAEFNPPGAFDDVQGGKDVGLAVDDHSASHAKGILIARLVRLHNHHRRQYGLVDLGRHGRIRGQRVHGLRNRRLHVHGRWLLFFGAEGSPENQGEQENHHAKRGKRRYRRPLPQRPPGPSPSGRAGDWRTVRRLRGLRLQVGPVGWNRSGARNLPPGCQTLRPMQVSAMNPRPGNRQGFPAIVSQPFQESMKVSRRPGQSRLKVRRRFHSHSRQHPPFPCPCHSRIPPVIPASHPSFPRRRESKPPSPSDCAACFGTLPLD